ncbi:unnamed protein product [Vitrella brassicaformis CCMP3155]|uniref:Uncharacterized protein n=1 Tax=Vitrella brassicaformis (strain CCMP3155) TaxID=1169540 RepID=A0A0G4ERP3_VITBC|nr:unnamed protein product [Vitrella brassicaformis CCMP3155]|eukprot:CEM00515.1 unnamed protein product [Vitrella brassicaformis CCMP3155]
MDPFDGPLIVLFNAHQAPARTVALALLLTKGGKVFCVVPSMQLSGLHETMAAIDANGGRAAAHEADVSRRSAVLCGMDEARRWGGRQVDYVVVADRGDRAREEVDDDVMALDVAEMEREMDWGLLPHVWATQAAARECVHAPRQTPLFFFHAMTAPGLGRIGPLVDSTHSAIHELTQARRTYNHLPVSPGRPLFAFSLTLPAPEPPPHSLTPLLDALMSTSTPPPFPPGSNLEVDPSGRPNELPRFREVTSGAMHPRSPPRERVVQSRTMASLPSLPGLVCVVSDASSDVGQAIAVALAKKRVQMVVCGGRESAEIVRGIEDEGGSAAPYEGTIDGAFTFAETHYGHCVDVYINTNGGRRDQRADGLDDAREVWRAEVIGAVRGCQMAIRHFQAAKPPKTSACWVLNLTSRRCVASHLTTAALHTLTRWLAHSTGACAVRRHHPLLDVRVVAIDTSGAHPKGVGDFVVSLLSGQGSAWESGSVIRLDCNGSPQNVAPD